MKRPVEILAFLAAILLASIACYGFGFSSMPALYGVAVCILFPIYRPNQQEPNPKPISPLAKFAILLIIVAVVGLLVWSAISGFTRDNNVWFEHWRYRPAVALATWLMVLWGLVLVFRSRIRACRNHEN